MRKENLARGVYAFFFAITQYNSHTHNVHTLGVYMPCKCSCLYSHVAIEILEETEPCSSYMHGKPIAQILHTVAVSI
jgi:hypothetical protein